MRCLCTPLRWLIALALTSAACDRNLEPFVPGEKPREPDLARIFPAGSDEESLLRGASAGGSTPAAPMPGSRGTAAAAPISGTIEIDSTLASDAPAGAVLFIIARSPAGGPPLAVRRFAEPTFPLRFEIGPENAMIQGRPFEGEMTLSARLDSDGNATTRDPTDLEGAVATPVVPGATGLTLTLAPPQAAP